ncbi:O-methylsterigmatocystin oxidoreductase [Mycena sanguinolenta]|uniref:O-methylsterigmatocystin oxidoreductase n=1 Tax=Mycena sanguinolenta TaxID=230812 RepID=A0A8H6X6U4_9AGAR|nr:O-methylsterigmatocystin oxidoreductase [Mycena sanguinolenta]
MEPLYFSFFTLILTAFLVFVLATRRKARNLPGPRGLPFIGSIHELPQENVWKVYSDWAAKYGGIFAFKVFNRQIVVINSISIATELIDKRARLYSDRPDLALIPLLGWGFDLAFMRIHDPRYRPYRKIIAQQFSRRIQKFEEVQLAECRAALFAILYNPADLFLLVNHFAASVILKTTYGQELGQNKRLVHLATEAVDVLSERVFFGAQLLYAFPLLRHLPWWAPVPGAGIKRFARNNTATVAEMVDLPIELLQNSLKAGGDIPCWATNLLQQDSETSVADIKAVTATSYAAGIHTAESCMKSFLLAMVLHPHCQELAQAEIDRVIGSGRLPSFEDRSQLPYVSALCREIFRWHPPVPLGVAHATSEDDIYDGYFIPKGSAVVANIWGMSRDANLFEDSNSFKPERFLKHGQLSDDPCDFIFGFGRRICPGQHYTLATVWLFVVSVLSVFTISKAKNESGEDIEVEERYTSTGLISQPLPFPYSISPRTSQAQMLIEQTQNTS